MPVIGISVDRLMALTRRGAEHREDITAERIEELLDQLGCDVDGVVDVCRYRSKHGDYVLELKPQETIPLTDPHSGYTGVTWEEVWELASTERQVLLELLPVRPDIFDAGGLARALRGYLGIETGLRDYHSRREGHDPDHQSWVVNVDQRIVNPLYGRPHVQCAVIRNLTMDDDLLRAVMKLQENIHWALCRDRKFASIGTYDLSTLTSPIHYTLIDPDEFRFTPLFWGGREPVSPRQMLAGHPKGMAYSHLLEGLDAYPALLDAQDRVLSLPPVINAHETKVTPQSRDLFIDVTGSSQPIVEKALAIMTTSLIELDLHGDAWVESVEIHYPSGKLVTPKLSTESFRISPGRASKLLGLSLSTADCVDLLERMRHGVEESGAEDSDGPRLLVTVPAYRTDILHEVDLVEDIAIAYGYHRIEPTLVPTFTPAASDALTERGRLAAAALTGLGFTETLSLVLTNERNHYERLRRSVAPNRVTVANPASSDQTMLRTHLLSSLLEQLAHNTDRPLPQRIFELGDVVNSESAPTIEPLELRTVAAAIIGTGTGYADGRAVMDALLHEMGYSSVSYLPLDEPAALPGRAAAIQLTCDAAQKPPHGLGRLEAKGSLQIGTIFELHPEVLEEWKLGAPVVMLSLLLGVVEWD
jgi:phenylalanyl-tRNA synthetase beta chain